MKKTLRIFISIVVIIVVISLSIFLTYLKNLKFKTEKDFEKIDFLFYRIEITKLKANVSYVKKAIESYPIGIEIHEKNLLTFGIIPIDSPIKRVRRILNIDNLDNIKAKVKIFCEGNICSFLNISDGVFILNSNEKRSIEISAENRNIEGIFNGNIYINVFKPRNKIWEFLIFLL